MRWMRTAVSLCLGVLAAAAFAHVSQRSPLDRTAAYTCDPSGNLYLLSVDEPVLSKVSPKGVLEWSIPLPAQGEDGASLRYGTVVSDRNGGSHSRRSHLPLTSSMTASVPFLNAS